MIKELKRQSDMLKNAWIQNRRREKIKATSLSYQCFGRNLYGNLWNHPESFSMFLKKTDYK